ncbi:hypothetical protein P8452_68104 [Trifolium repens]|jgi:hypothetical protein|nr:hypothetical protein P8452_23490 [Trifolium repens]WJX85690.1 hypothetical protein P8452_68104 [Trifolium repens]
MVNLMYLCPIRIGVCPALRWCLTVSGAFVLASAAAVCARSGVAPCAPGCVSVTCWAAVFFLVFDAFLLCVIAFCWLFFVLTIGSLCLI